MSRLVWSLWAVAIVMVMTGAVLSVVAEVPIDRVVDERLLPPLMVTLGALVAARVPRNPIGWILLGVGVLGGFDAVLTGYADLALLVGFGSRRLGEVAAGLSLLLWAPLTLVPLTFVLLLFPDGRLPSPRWRPLPWMAALSITATTAFVLLNPDLGEDPRWPLENSFALDEGSPVLAVLGFGWVLVVLALFAAAASLIVRFRSSRGVEREQLKWVAYGGAIGVVLWTVTGTLFDETVVGQVGTTAGLAMIPASIAMAILRYRLYDIDRLISRTVSYALLSGVLVGVYAAGVLLLSRVLAPVGAGSDLAVAVATLAAAAVFQPARRRIQEAVDRRFNRRRYDAQRTVEVFSSRLRSEFDLDALGSELEAVAAKTMEPAALSLWLRTPEGRR